MLDVSCTGITGPRGEVRVNKTTISSNRGLETWPECFCKKSEMNIEHHLQPSNPGEERVPGRGASGANRKDGSVFLLVHWGQPRNSSTRCFLAIHPPWRWQCVDRTKPYPMTQQSLASCDKKTCDLHLFILLRLSSSMGGGGGAGTGGPLRMK